MGPHYAGCDQLWLVSHGLTARCQCAEIQRTEQTILGYARDRGDQVEEERHGLHRVRRHRVKKNRRAWLALR